MVAADGRKFSRGIQWREFNGGNSADPEGIQWREFNGGNSMEGIQWREFGGGNSAEGIQWREYFAVVSGANLLYGRTNWVFTLLYSKLAFLQDVGTRVQVPIHET